ncbi:TRAF3-interacting protein 1 [Fopius arisanus]|uniref:TRAF3-interacting protein 1 n=1 Tax=Fopius arisanus TaxID=64838 RepID=A0A0C9R516_9HYME|nr:PREDICTED: TRAF3-interacting protein 1 [Fopius arisanus]
MSEEGKLQESVKKTQDLLGKFVKKPPLTEKLLRKPPFRFLHDIINAIIKETGFLKGLFTDEELISSNITDKDAKLGYLTKLIDAMKLITGQELSVRPSKIVSGQEPVKTNELLQLIAKSIDKKISSSEAIEHYKESLEKKERQRSKKSDEKPRKSSSSEKLRRFREAEEKRKSSEEKPREPSEEKSRKSTKKAPSERTRSKEPDRREKEEKGRTEKDQKERRERGERDRREKEEKDAKRKKPREDSVERKSKQREAERSKKKRSSSPKKAPEPRNEEESMEPSKDSTESIHEEKREEEEILPPQVLPPEEPKLEEAPTAPEPLPDTSPPAKTHAPASAPQRRSLLRPPSARPPSARPGAPKLKGKGDFVINTSGLQMGDVHVIVENFDNKDDDEGMVVVESSSNEEAIVGNSELLNKELTKEHGYLVAQILETQRELVNEGNVEIIPKVEIEWEAGMRKEKEAVIREVEKLRGTIQGLTRTTNPLGKLMDFLQEDAEIMEKELWDWRGQFSDLREQLVKERNGMKDAVKPLEESLKEIEGTISAQMEKILQTKANIMRNNQKIQKLLSGR